MVYVLAANLIWGSVGVFARWSGASSSVIVFFRLVFGWAALAVIGPVVRRRDGFVRAGGQGAPGTAGPATGAADGLGAPGVAAGPGRPVWLLAAAGIVLALNWVFFFRALLTTTFLTTMVAYYTAPLIAAAAAPWVLGECGSPRAWAGLGLSFLGVAVTILGGQRGGAAAGPAAIGTTYALIAAVFYAGALLFGRYLRDVPAPTLAKWETGAAAVAFAPLVLAGSGPFAAAMRWPSIAILGLMGLVHTAFALTMLLKGLQLVPARVAGLLTYVDPISAVLFAWLFFGENPGAAALAGGLMVLAGNLVGRPTAGG